MQMCKQNELVCQLGPHALSLDFDVNFKANWRNRYLDPTACDCAKFKAKTYGIVFEDMGAAGDT